MDKAKAVPLIVLGSFLISSNALFAGEAMEQLKSMAASTVPAVEKFDGAANKGGNTNLAAQDAKGTSTGTAPASAAQKSDDKPPEVKPPTLGESIKGFLKKNKGNMIYGAVGAYLGFAVAGTVLGALTGGIGFVFLFALLTA